MADRPGQIFHVTGNTLLLAFYPYANEIAKMKKAALGFLVRQTDQTWSSRVRPTYLTGTTISAYSPGQAWSSSTVAALVLSDACLQHSLLLHELCNRPETSVVSQAETLALLSSLDCTDRHEAGKSCSLGLKLGFDDLFAAQVVEAVGRRG